MAGTLSAEYVPVQLVEIRRVECHVTDQRQMNVQLPVSTHLFFASLYTVSVSIIPWSSTMDSIFTTGWFITVCIS